MAEIEHLPMVPSTIRDGALAELDRLTHTVERLSLSDWSRPSAAQGWTIGDVVAHLDLVLGVYNRLLDAVLAGGGSTGMAKTIGRFTSSVLPSAGGIVNTINSAIPKVMDRALAPEVVKGQFAAAARKTRERLERVGANDYNREVHYVGGPYPLSFFLAMMVNELAIHGWDIESEIEEVADLSDDARRILPWFYWSGTKLMLRPSKEMKGTIQVLLSEPGSAMWWTISAEGIKEGRETTPNPDAEIRGPSGPYILTLAGRLKPAGELQSSLVAVGDRGLAERFLESWHLL